LESQFPTIDAARHILSAPNSLHGLPSTTAVDPTTLYYTSIPIQTNSTEPLLVARIGKRRVAVLGNGEVRNLTPTEVQQFSLEQMFLGRR
jgi:hypothetical protein